MSWILQLYETYENHVSKIGLIEQSGSMLWPIAHTTAVAHVQVHLDDDGNFLTAKPVPDNGTTLIPCTERSASRSGKKPTAHPLSDKLQYLAGDFIRYGGKVTSGFNNNPDEPRKELIDWLTRWTNYDQNKKLLSILKYLKKGCLVRDLVDNNILPVDQSDEPQLLKDISKEIKEKYMVCNGLAQSQNPQDVFVRWAVEIPGDSKRNLWEDEELWNSWDAFYQSTINEESWCQITGRTQKLASIHPSKIRNGGDKAKIISSNDDSGFTFRGRFTDKVITDVEGKNKTIGDSIQACGTGFSVSQKAHNALRWLIARQGYRNDDQVIVSWAVSGKDVPKITDNSLDFLGIEFEQTDEAYSGDVGQRFVLKLNKKIAGYQKELGSSERIVVMELDSATPGRLSIAFYRELTGSDFLKRIEDWHLDFAWLLGIFIKDQSKKSRLVWRTCAPSPKNITEAAYGQRLDDKLKKTTVERLLPCIVDGNPLPADLLESCVRRTSNRVSMEDWEWQQALGISCALYKGYYTRISDTNQRRLYKMTLERERKSRDYLFGRLLAVAEQIESYALYKVNEKRITGAERLMLRFASHPCSAWKTIEESLRPYKDRLRASNDAGLLHYWETEIEEVCSLFDIDDFISDRPLSGEYLLGYHCQKQYKKLKPEQSIEESNGSESSTEGQL